MHYYSIVMDSSGLPRRFTPRKDGETATDSGGTVTDSGGTATATRAGQPVGHSFSDVP